MCAMFKRRQCINQRSVGLGRRYTFKVYYMETSVLWNSYFRFFVLWSGYNWNTDFLQLHTDTHGYKWHQHLLSFLGSTVCTGIQAAVFLPHSRSNKGHWIHERNCGCPIPGQKLFEVLVSVRHKVVNKIKWLPFKHVVSVYITSKILLHFFFI